MDEAEGSVFKPPYLPFKTFWSFIEELRSKPLPPHLDRSMLRSKSGTDQANLLAALKAFGLIQGESNAVCQGLRELITVDEEQGKRLLEGLLRSSYPRQIALSEQNATEKALNDSFEEDFGVNGETRRKAVTFFLQAARFSGMAVSAHFPTTRLGSGRPAATRPKSTAQRKPSTGSRKLSAGATPNGKPSGNADTITVNIGGWGRVTLIVDVRYLDLPDDTFVKLRQVTKDLRSLGEDYGFVGADGEADEM